MDFANHPVSIAEARAQKPDDRYDPRTWTPRDVLIDMLRDIDSGKLNPQSLIIIMQGEASDDLTPLPLYRYACKTGATHMLGIVDLALSTMRDFIRGIE